MRTLIIDIGGTGIKLLPVSQAAEPLAESQRELTPRPATPDAVFGLIERMIGSQEPFDRVSVGFPGVIVHGRVKTAPNLGTDDWRDIDLAGAVAAMTGKPTRALNDADLQGFGVIEGRGVELVLTLGTGLGTALYVDGALVPNLEMAHHPLEAGRTYEELVSDAELDRIGEQRWRERIALVLRTLEPIFNYDLLHIGGGNARKLPGPFADNVRLFGLVAGLRGGVRLWQSQA